MQVDGLQLRARRDRNLERLPSLPPRPSIASTTTDCVPACAAVGVQEMRPATIAMLAGAVTRR